jgi:UDP-N-acetylmuramoyl-L-alanyl-D-glutamate--2,6-diaminopimelate ligase
MTRNLASLLKALRLPSQAEWQEVEITGITEDSRLIKPGFLFVAIRGYVDDGHLYIDEAIARGATAVITEQDIPCSVPCIRVIDARIALARLSATFFGDPTQGMFTVGVTGTNGKTTVCHLIAHLLDEEKTALISTVANEDRGLRAVTTPSSSVIQQIAHEAVSKERKNLVIEVSSAALVLHRVDRVDFDAAVFTNLTHDHLDFHADWESYLSAKLLLFRGLKSEAFTIVNADDPVSERVLAANTGQPITYAINSDADLRAIDIHYKLRETTFMLRADDEAVATKLRLPGEHNLYNALAAAAVAMSKRMSVGAIAERLGSAHNVEGRYQFFQARNGAAVIVDFAHSPDSLEKMLKSLRPYYKRVICVFGCGGESDRKKRPLMGKISGELADLTILTSDNPKTEDPKVIIDEIEAGLIPTGGRYEKIVDRREAISRAMSLAKQGDVVLIAGKGHEPYQIIGHKFVPYSDGSFLREVGLVE